MSRPSQCCGVDLGTVFLPPAALVGVRVLEPPSAMVVWLDFHDLFLCGNNDVRGSESVSTSVISYLSLYVVPMHTDLTLG